MKDKSMINMAGTSMGSYDKPMMKGSGLEMKCGSQVGKHMKMGGPKMMGGDKKKGFRELFAENRKAGKKEFKYEGKMYNTKTAEDVAKGLSDEDLYKAYERAYNSTSSFDNVPGSEQLKSRNEIEKSYFNEGEKRESAKNAKIEKAFLGGLKAGAVGGAKMMGGDKKKVKNKTQVNKPKQTFSSNKDTWDRATHKGFTDLQYNISEKDKSDNIWPGGYKSGKTTAKLVAIKTGGWDKEMQRSLEDVEDAHLKGTFGKNFYQGYKDVMSKGGIKTKAHQKWEADNYKHRFVKSKY